MAQYNVKTISLDEASECFSIFAGDLGRYCEGIDSMLSKFPDEMTGFRKQLAGRKESLIELSRNIRKVGVTLCDVADHYSRAEHNVMSGQSHEIKAARRRTAAIAVPKIRNSSGAVLFERTVMPDWLQAAVMKYEQSRG